MFSYLNKSVVVICLSLALSAQAESQNQAPTATPVESPSSGIHKVVAKPKLTLVPEIGNTSFHVTGFNSKYRSGNMIGAKARFTTSNERLNWLVGAQYLQGGFKLAADFGFLSINVAEVSTDYLAVPVAAEYLLSAPNTTGVKYFVTGGLTPAYLLSARLNNLTDSEQKEQGIRSEMNGLDVLAGFGFGGRWESPIGVVEMGLDYQKGLRDVYKDLQSRNEGFMLKAGYNVAL
jgi:hypothetical protein